MFVIAMLSSSAREGTGGSVRVRNMSPSGALVEGDALPDVGETVSLERGERALAGTVVWKQDRKAGLRFDTVAKVQDWLPAGGRTQQQVDETVRQMKLAPTPLAPPGSNGQLESGYNPDKAELEGLAMALDRLADVLSDDPAIVRRYGANLQVFDLASQAFRRLAASRER